MPCRDEILERLEADEARERAHKTTRLFCEVLRMLDGSGLIWSQEVEHWWRDHKADDAERRQREEEAMHTISGEF